MERERLIVRNRDQQNKIIFGLMCTDFMDIEIIKFWLQRSVYS